MSNEEYVPEEYLSGSLGTVTDDEYFEALEQVKRTYVFFEDGEEGFDPFTDVVDERGLKSKDA